MNPQFFKGLSGHESRRLSWLDIKMVLMRLQFRYWSIVGIADISWTCHIVQMKLRGRLSSRKIWFSWRDLYPHLTLSTPKLHETPLPMAVYFWPECVFDVPLPVVSFAYRTLWGDHKIVSPPKGPRALYLPHHSNLSSILSYISVHTPFDKIPTTFLK